MLTFCINDSAIVKLEQEPTRSIFDVHKIVNQKFNIAMDIGGFVAVKTQSSRHGEFGF